MFKRYTREKSRIRGLRKVRSLLTENGNLNIVPAGIRLFGWMVKGLTPLTSTK